MSLQLPHVLFVSGIKLIIFKLPALLSVHYYIFFRFLILITIALTSIQQCDQIIGASIINPKFAIKSRNCSINIANTARQRIDSSKCIKHFYKLCMSYSYSEAEH